MDKRHPECEYLPRWLVSLAENRETIGGTIRLLETAKGDCFRALLENTPDAIADDDGLLRRVADAMEGLRGFGLEFPGGSRSEPHPAFAEILAPALALANEPDGKIRRQWLDRGFRTNAKNLLFALLALLSLYRQLRYCAGRAPDEVWDSGRADDVLRVFRFAE